MSDRLDLNTRSKLETKIASTLAAFQSRAVDLSAEALAAEIVADVRELQYETMAAMLAACYGPDMGAAAYADLTGRLDVSDAELARRFGLEHSTVSKTLQKLRRNFGLPLRQPQKARTHRRNTKGPSAL